MNHRKVFGIGLGKTGTTSLASAMGILGFRVEHSPKYVDDIRHCDFANDISIAWRFRFLDFVYPQARFILTVRELSSWLASSAGHEDRRRKRGCRTGGPLRRLENRYMCFGRVDFDEKDFTLAYERHVHAVTVHFRDRPGKLLVMNICAGDGWNVLCPFLGIELPSAKFPYEGAAGG